MRTRTPVWLGVVVTLVALYLVAPTLVVIPLSFTDRKSFQFPPSGWSLDFYRTFFTDPAWYGALLNSLWIAAIVAACATLLGTAAAIGLDRAQFRGSTALTALLLAPMVMPQIVFAVGIYLVFLKWHLVGTMVGFVVAHTVLALPFVIINVRTSLASFDIRLDQAAANLGASPWRRFRQVTLPLIRPGILSGAVFAFVVSFDEVVVAIYVHSPTLQTLPVEMFTSVTYQTDPTMAAASTVVLASTTLLISLLGLASRKKRRNV